MSRFQIKLGVEGVANDDLALAFQGRLTEALATEQERIARVYQISANQVADRFKKELRADIVAGGF